MPLVVVVFFLEALGCCSYKGVQLRMLHTRRNHRDNPPIGLGPCAFTGHKRGYI